MRRLFTPFHLIFLLITLIMMLFAWIVMEPTIAEPADISPRYGFTSDDVYLLSQLISGDKNKDGDGEYDIDFKNPLLPKHIHEVHKVLCIVMNRQRHHKWPNTVRDILLQKGQFMVFPRNLKKIPGEKTINLITDWCASYDIGDKSIQVIPEKHIYFSGDGRSNKTR